MRKWLNFHFWYEPLLWHTILYVKLWISQAQMWNWELQMPFSWSRPHSVSGSPPHAKTNSLCSLIFTSNEPPERQATASCSAREEWNRLYTWENIAHTVTLYYYFFFQMGSRGTLPVRFHLRAPLWGWGTGDVGEGGVFAHQWSGEGQWAFWYSCQTREQSTSVHAPPPTVRCQHLKPGLSKNAVTLISATYSFHAHMSTQSGAKCAQSACFIYRIRPVVPGGPGPVKTQTWRQCGICKIRPY